MSTPTSNSMPGQLGHFLSECTLEIELVTYVRDGHSTPFIGDGHSTL